MARSARASVLKKNNSRLKSKVFGPVEQARAERLNKKLLELVQQQKPSDAVNVEEGAEKDTVSKMEIEADKPDIMSNTAIKKARDSKKHKIEKKRFRKERNRIAFKKHPMKSKR